MGLRQSKEQTLYLHATAGNVEGVRALHRDGAGLEWIDKEGKTPLIFSCLRPDGLEMARTLLELGANINAYRPGSHAGTPLHHAAKKGFEQIVNLLLSYGANTLKMNDDCQTPLDLARAKGHCNVVHTIENHTCLFAGWLRELYGPGFLETFAPKWVSRKIWAVILPCHQRSSTSPVKLELALYPTLQVAKPHTVVSLWKVDIEEANFNQPDPVVVIVDKPGKKRFKFLSAHEGDKQQLLWFYNACKGTIQHNIPIPNHLTSASPASVPISAVEDADLAMAINASLQSAVTEGLASGMPSEVQNDNANGWANTENNNCSVAPDGRLSTAEGSGGWANEAGDDGYKGWSIPASKPSTSTQHQHVNQQSMPAIPQTLTAPDATPSAPPLNEDIFTPGSISYPSVDSSPVDQSRTATQGKSTIGDLKESKGDSGTCVICLDAPVEGACIPCGHMAGCMPCLTEIKAKQWGCPICRTEIGQVVKLYSV